MKEFAKQITELFTQLLPLDAKLDVACRLACQMMEATSASIFIYSGKEDILKCRGRYIDCKVGKVKIEGDQILLDFLKKVDVCDLLFYYKFKKSEINKYEPAILYKEFKDNYSYSLDISWPEFNALYTNFIKWKDKYDNYKKILREESYDIDDDTLAGHFYKNKLNFGKEYSPDLDLKDLQRTPLTQKQKCITYLEKELNLTFRARYYVALPLFANKRYFGVLRFLFPETFTVKKDENDHISTEYPIRDRLKYLAQIVSLHLENIHFLEGYKSTYLSSRVDISKAKFSDDFLNQQCELLAEIIESKGAMIRQRDEEEKTYRIIGHSDAPAIKKYIDYVKLEKKRFFFQKVSEKFSNEDVIGVHLNCHDPFRITKYLEYDNTGGLEPQPDNKPVPVLKEEGIDKKLIKLGMPNVAILPIPEVERTFIIFFNNPSRPFLNKDVKMIYPALKNLGMELNAADYTKKIETRMDVINSMHEETSALFRGEPLKAHDYVRKFLDIMANTIKRIGFFSNHINWVYVREIVPPEHIKENEFLLRNITRKRFDLEIPWKKGRAFKFGKGSIYKLNMDKDQFERKIINYFEGKHLTKILDLYFDEGYMHVDLPFHAENVSEEGLSSLAGIISLIFKEDEKDLIEQDYGFFKFMQFFSKQLSLAWNTVLENISIKIQEKFEKQLASIKSGNLQSKLMELNVIMKIITDELDCDLGVFLMADNYKSTLQLISSNIPLKQNVQYNYNIDKKRLSVRSFNEEKNFRIPGRKRLMEIANREKLENTERELKTYILSRIKERTGISFKKICIQHWQTVLIRTSDEKLGLIELYRMKGFNRSKDLDQKMRPPFTEFEINLLNRIQKYIFIVIIAHREIQKRIKDVRTILHQTIAPLNALISQTNHLLGNTLSLEKVNDSLNLIRTLSKMSYRYSTNFMRIFEVESGNINLRKVVIPDLRKFLLKFAQEYQPLMKTRDMSLRNPLKVAIIPTFRGIVVQVRIFSLKMAKKPFSAGKLLLETAFLPFPALYILFIFKSSLRKNFF